MIVEEEDYLAHYGILRKSGRYPWGSGGNPYQRSVSFMDTVDGMREKGMSDAAIAKAFSTPDHPFSTKQLREARTIAVNAKRAADMAQAVKLREQGHSNVGIGEKMGINESSVRSLLARYETEKQDILTTTSDMLREQVDTGAYIDIGRGVAASRGISNEKLASSVAILKDEGYEVINVQVDQAGTGAGKKTTVKVLAPPGTTYADVKQNMENIRQVDQRSDDGGRTMLNMLPPKSIDSSRVAVAYKEDGGDLADGVMYVRPGVDDVSLGGSRYAQVRVMVDGTHYLKGMAIYKDGLPEGTDILFNTNKSKVDVGDDPLGALKTKKDDPDNPFGAVVDQIGPRDSAGNLLSVTSAMNIVNREGDWEGWKSSIASQVLSKQSPVLADRQLGRAYDRSRQELDEILSLTNPAVKAKLLQSYADGVDSAAVHLKAAALPRQASHVIIPTNTLKDNEIYAPNYRDGERVALIRYPHGGTFEIPEVTVNNRNAGAKALLGNAPDAVGINSQVAKRLSGADFDGDSVLVIPNNAGVLKSTSALKGLKDFDPQTHYPPYDGMPTIDGGKWNEKTKSVEYGPKGPTGAKQTHMGVVSNLITDMTIQGASSDEIARAVRHSMVVIDAEKHHLNYKESYKANGISALQKKYQLNPETGRAGGASTLISRATSPARIPARTPRPASQGGPIDPATGKRVYVQRPGFVDKTTGQERFRMEKVERLRLTDDAHTLVSRNGGTKMERVYADHSNRMKSLANEARKELVTTGTLQRSPSAARVYRTQVDSLDAKLNLALRNSPRERQAQLYAASVLQAKRDANPNMDGAQRKRIEAQALAEGRVRFGAKKQQIDITTTEWDAIQAGAISNHKLKQILNNTDIERVRELATPRRTVLMNPGNVARAKAMLAAGRTQAEVASALGMSVTTLKEGLKSG